MGGGLEDGTEKESGGLTVRGEDKGDELKGGVVCHNKRKLHRGNRPL